MCKESDPICSVPTTTSPNLCPVDGVVHRNIGSDSLYIFFVSLLVNKILYIKGEVRRKMNFTYVLGFVVLRDVVKVFPASSSSFARKTTGRNRARSHSGA